MAKRKCKYCKEEFEKKSPLQYLCFPPKPCSWKYQEEQRKKRAKQEWNKEKKVLKEKLKTLSEYEKDARVWFQKWIRKRDESLPCISCGRSTAKQWDGGHFYKAEIYSGLIFDENNCHKQCSQCNDLYSGNELAYREGLIKRYGEGYVKDLENRKDAARNYKYSKDQLIEIKNEYQNRLKAIK